MDTPQVPLEDFPDIPRDLVESLERLFPERCPETSWTDRQIWRKVGQRSVVRMLWEVYEQQQQQNQQDNGD